MARSERRKAELQLKYGNNAFTPIRSEYIEQARKLSARYMLFVNKDNRHGYCESCCKDIEFAKTKHKEKITCPNCGTELTIMHTWRKTKCEYNVDWYVVGECVDDDTFALRYIEVKQRENYTKEIDERAREIYDYKHGWSYQFSNLYWSNGWTIDSRYNFTEFNMGWFRRKECCIGSKPINNTMAELSKISAFKYFDQFGEYSRVYTYPRDNAKCLLNVPLYEKLEKVGLSKLSMADYKAYLKNIRFKRSETSLLKMLGLDRPRYNLLFKNQTIKVLDFIRSNKGMALDLLDYIISNNAISEYMALDEIDDERKRVKSMKYLVKQNINAWEYNHYVRLLKALNYKLDDAYLYPKDFRKADDRVSDEYLKMTNRKAYNKLKRNDRLIKKISDGLRKMEDLQEFLNGSNGLLVYVPESRKELIETGRQMHNCIGTYVDRIAEGKTLVFFVRRLNAPNDPFVAFEYANGEVIQCRADYNEDVKDEKIISFVDAFAERLRKNNILYKAA